MNLKQAVEFIHMKRKSNLEKQAVIAGVLGGLGTAANTGSAVTGAIGGVGTEVAARLGASGGDQLAQFLAKKLNASPESMNNARLLGGLLGYGAGGYGGYRASNAVAGMLGQNKREQY